MRRWAVLPLMLATLVACGDSTGPTIPDLTGTWSGSAGGGDWSITISENEDGELSGSGSVESGGESVSLTVTGSHAHPDFSMTWSSSGVQDVNYAGTVGESGDQLNGELNGSGFSGESLTMTRDSQ